MALIDEANMGERDIAAWVRILERLREDEERARSTRLRIAIELGFDARHPRDVKVGDTIRTRAGLWVRVAERNHFDAEEAESVRGSGHGGQPFYRFYFGTADGWFDVEDISDDHPVGPASVLVASPEASEVF